MIKRRKPKISKRQAMGLAADYLAKQELRGWRLDVVEAYRAGIYPDSWTVIIDHFSPEGTLVDGPQALIVNGTTGEVSTFDAYYE